MQVRTRFAPSPTGYLHIGGLRTALYTYLFAKKYDGVFMLRIEDTDQERLVDGAVEKIYSSLRAAGLNWDEGPDVGGDYGPYIQSERKSMYLPYAKQLVEKGEAYYCFCTKEELDERRAAAEAKGETWKYDKHCADLSKEEIERRLAAGESYVIRQKVPTQGRADFDDLLYGHIEVDCAELDDNVLIKADGLPTYNFANVIDDHTMGITHVLRGNEYLSSTPKYNLLYDAFGWERPVYIHLTPVMKDATRKLSKRYGDPSFEDLLDKGYLTEAIVNYVALVGWNPGENREFFTMEELVEAFSKDGLSKSPAIFDETKLTWMNGEYIKRMDDAQFKAKVTPWLAKEGFPVEKYDLDIICSLLKTRLEVLSGGAAMFDFLENLPAFDAALYTHKKMKTNTENSLAALKECETALAALDDFSMSGVHECLLGLVAKLGVKNGQILWPVRTAVSNLPSTPGGASEICALLGKEETLRRIRLGIEGLQNAAAQQ